MKIGWIGVVLVATFTIVIQSCKASSELTSEKSNAKNEESTFHLIDEKKSLFKKLQEHQELPIDELIAFYHQLKKEHFDEYDFENERGLNNLGYTFLFNGKVKSAIEIFKLMVAEFPNSANAYDSLGEGYFKDGNDELALLNYEKSLALNPNNNHAIDQVTILKGLELLVTDWGKEFFHFPLHFAEEIPYEGVEEVVFPKNWIKPDSTDFWSYVFIWSLENKKEVTAEELEENLTLYFDGLIGGLSRVDSTKLTKASVSFERNTDPEDSVLFTGKLHIFDGFATQEPITLNARIYSDYCSQKDQLNLLFRFSPLTYDQPIWDKLRTVKVRSTVCLDD